MSSGSVRRFTSEDIQRVQDLIEKCLQLYMKRIEVEETLFELYEIDPRFTGLLWQKLEEENKEFFNAYYQRLALKHQIVEFNSLLGRQARLMNEMNRNGVATEPTYNGSHIPAVDLNTSNSAAEASGTVPESEIHNPYGSSMPNEYSNESSSLHATMLSGVDIYTHSDSISVSPTILYSHNSHANQLPVVNGGMIRSEIGYPESSPYMFGNDISVLCARTIGDACANSFGGIEPSWEAIPGPYLDTTQCGSLYLIPSLSDFSVDFSQYSVNYSRPHFPASDGEQFLNPPQTEEQGKHKRSESVSDGSSHEEIQSKYLI